MAKLGEESVTSTCSLFNLAAGGGVGRRWAFLSTSIQRDPSRGSQVVVEVGGGAAGKNVKSRAVSCPWRKQVESVTLEPGQQRGERGAGMLRKEVEEMVQLTLKRCFNPHGTTDHTLRADS